MGPVAQLVEQTTNGSLVAGSSPALVVSCVHLVYVKACHTWRLCLVLHRRGGYGVNWFDFAEAKRQQGLS